MYRPKTRDQIDSPKRHMPTCQHETEEEEVDKMPGKAFKRTRWLSKERNKKANM